MTHTIFSWGYYGWGNHTAQLIEAVDAVEESRGFKPPVFVDIRIRRSVRARGFTGANFEKLLGDGRHVWMKSLGNERILSGKGPGIQIAAPGTAKDLLHLAQSKAKEKRRLIYFCSCQWPRCKGTINCHRTTVTRLLLKAARKEQTVVQVVEWPGGNARLIHLDLNPDDYRAVLKGRMTIPLDGDEANAGMLGLPWCSIATLRSAGKSVHRIVGPAMRQKKQWCLPVLWLFFDPETGIAKYKRQAEKLRRELGLNASR